VFAKPKKKESPEHNYSHRSGARPGRPCPVPACSGQPLSGERRFSSPLRNRIFFSSISPGGPGVSHFLSLPLLPGRRGDRYWVAVTLSLSLPLLSPYLIPSHTAETPPPKLPSRRTLAVPSLVRDGQISGVLHPVVVGVGAWRVGRGVWGWGGGAGPGRGPPPAVWRGAAVLRLRWPPSPCRGAARCGLLLVAGGVAGAGAGRRRMPRGRWRPTIGGRPH
jgi:hypothetical protein